MWWSGQRLRSPTTAGSAAAAAKYGLECHLLLRGGRKDMYPPQGNLLLDHLLGAKVRSPSR